MKFFLLCAIILLFTITMASCTPKDSEGNSFKHSINIEGTKLYYNYSIDFDSRDALFYPEYAWTDEWINTTQIHYDVSFTFYIDAYQIDFDAEVEYVNPYNEEHLSAEVYISLIDEYNYDNGFEGVLKADNSREKIGLFGPAPANFWISGEGDMRYVEDPKFAPVIFTIEVFSLNYEVFDTPLILSL